MRPVQYEMYVPWRKAGQGLTTILDMLSRPVGVRPKVCVERLPTHLACRGLVAHLHVSAIIRDEDDPAKVADDLIGKGAIVQWWELSAGHIRRRDEHRDPFAAIWGVQIRAAEVEATIAHNDGVRAWRRGYDGGASFATSEFLETWAWNNRNALWHLYGVEP